MKKKKIGGESSGRAGKNARKVSKTKFSARKPGVKRSITEAARRVRQRAADVLERSHKLHAASDLVHTRSEDLHGSIHQMHEDLEQRNLGPAPGPEPVELVTDDNQSGNGAPFPIVGIGASAGGFEAFNEFVAHLPRTCEWPLFWSNTSIPSIKAS